MAYSGSQYTRLGLYGGTRGLYGSFLGKTTEELASKINSMLASQIVRRRIHRGRR